MVNVKNDDGSKEAIDPHNLVKNDIDDLIKQSKLMIGEFQKTFAELIETREFLIKIKEYIDELNLDQKYYDAFLEEIGRKVPSEIKGPEIQCGGNVR